MGITEDTGEKPARRKKQLRETAEAIVIAVALALVIRAFIIQAFKIPSGSMEDTLLVGDHILVSKFAYGIQVPRPAMIKVFDIPVPFFETKLYNAWGSVRRGDVVVFRFPAERDKDYIKRVIGLPGDTIEVKGKSIFINNVRWDDPYGVFKDGLWAGSGRAANFGPYTVPEGRIFAMGDNRDRSYDSRWWGTVPIYDIKGKALIVYWSWDGHENWVRFGRIAKLIK